jgi:hypothetical protein
MLPTTRHTGPVLARLRAMPDLLDRTRLASVAVLAAFVALAMALVGHLAATGVPASLPLLPGGGEVLTTSDEASGRPATQSAPGQGSSTSGIDTSTVAPGSAPTATNATGAGSGTAGSPSGPAGAPQLNAEDTRQVGISVGSGIPDQPSATPGAPGAPSSPGAGAGTGTGTPGTGPSGSDPGEDPSSPPSNQSGGPANNWGHTPSTPAPPVGATAGGHSASSGQPATGAQGEGMGKAPNSSVSAYAGVRSGPRLSKLEGLASRRPK